MHQQPAPHIGRVDPLQPGQTDRADIDPRSERGGIGDVQRAAGRAQIGHRRLHVGKGVAVLLQRGQQPGPRRQHVAGHRRRAGSQAERRLLRPGQGLARRQGQADRAETEHRAGLDRDADGGTAALRQGGEQVGQRRIGGGTGCHADGDLAGVVAEAFQRRAQPGLVGAGAAGQRERTDRLRLLQGHQAGRAAERCIQRRVAGRCQRHGVGLRIGGPRRRAEPGCEQDRADGAGR